MTGNIVSGNYGYLSGRRDAQYVLRIKFEVTHDSTRNFQRQDLQYSEINYRIYSIRKLITEFPNTVNFVSGNYEYYHE